MKMVQYYFDLCTCQTFEMWNSFAINIFVFDVNYFSATSTLIVISINGYKKTGLETRENRWDSKTEWNSI